MSKKNSTIFTEHNKNLKDKQKDQKGDLTLTQQDFNYQVYNQYKKIYDTALNLSKQIHQLLERKENAWLRLGEYEKRAEQFKDNIRGEPPQKKKRSRRTADQIQRQYVCDVERCHKCYGTEGSLYQHIKLKHPKLYAELKQKNGGLSHSMSQIHGSNNENENESVSENESEQNSIQQQEQHSDIYSQMRKKSQNKN